MDCKPGTMINTRVRLVRHLGSDQGDDLWLGQHIEHDRRVAVRLLAGGAKAPEDWLPVAAVIDYGLCADGTPYVVKALAGEAAEDAAFSSTADEGLETGRFIQKHGLPLAVSESEETDDGE